MTFAVVDSFVAITEEKVLCIEDYFHVAEWQVFVSN